MVTFLIIRAKKKKKEEDETIASSGPSKSSNNATTWTNDIFPIGRGSSGDNVKYVQMALNKIYNAGLAEDGKFGAATEAAVLQHLGVKEVGQVQASALIRQYTLGIK